MIELEFTVKVYAEEKDGFTPDTLDLAFEQGGAFKVQDAIRDAFTPAVRVELGAWVARRVEASDGL